MSLIQQDFETITVDSSFHHTNLPTLISPTNSANWQDCIHEIKQLVEQQLHRTGGFLFRGFNVQGAEVFNQFARAFNHDLLNYDYASTPRSKVSGGVYTSTEYGERSEWSEWMCYSSIADVSSEIIMEMNRRIAMYVDYWRKQNNIVVDVEEAKKSISMGGLWT